jgi:hypothetical protein
MWTAGFSSCGECDMDRLGFVSIYHPYLHLCEAMPGSLSVANTAVMSANVAVVKLRLAGHQCIAGITVAPGHCPRVHMQ